VEVQAMSTSVTPPRPPDRFQRGAFLLLLTLWLHTVFLLMGASSLIFLQTLSQSVWGVHRQNQAMALTEAGVQEALWEINRGGADFAGWTALALTNPACAGAVAACHQKSRPLAAADGSGQGIGAFTVTVLDPAGATPTVRSSGFVPSATNPMASRALRVTLARTQASTFDRAFFARRLGLGESTTGSAGGANASVLIDSYDSRVGPYGGGNVGSNAHVGANDYLTIRSHVDLHGNVYHTPTTQVTIEPEALTNIQFNGGIVDGTQSARTFPPLVVPPELASLPSLGSLTLSSGTTTCSGDRHYSQITVQSSAVLVLAPGCRLYLDVTTTDGLLIQGNGKVEAQGNNKIFSESAVQSKSTLGFVTTPASPNPLPRDLQIYTKGFQALLVMRGAWMAQRAPFYGVIYSQNGAITLQHYKPTLGSPDPTATAYGAFVSGSADTALINNQGEVSSLHYDKSLNDLALDGTGTVSATASVQINSWTYDSVP
jgi:hypothetical protein